MRVVEQLKWCVRLFVFPNNRVAVHMPLLGFDRYGRWRDFVAENQSLPLHWHTLKEIGKYLGTQGASLDFWQKHSGGMFEGKTEENWVIWVDLKLRLSHVRWFPTKKKEWKDSFDQKSIYITIHPLWILEEKTDSTN